jgi:putative transposase
MRAVTELATLVPRSSACKAFGVSRASFYRQQRPVPSPAVPADPPRRSPRRLALVERTAVLDTLNSERFADRAPAQVYATLLDEGVYLCSISTMYRILRAESQVRERRAQMRRTNYAKPELLALAPNQVWSWDITRLRGLTRWAYFHLYVIIDIFSRLVVGWLVADRESPALAVTLIQETCSRHNILPGQLLCHADRGCSMTSKPVAFLLVDLGVERTHSRPHVSNDNPYSESQFKTMKYRPEFPDHFASIQEARLFCQRFFLWYNTEHRHSGIGLLTPADVHYGRADEVTARRAGVLSNAFASNPERFVRGLPLPPTPPLAAWINPPVDQSAALQKRSLLSPSNLPI